MKMLEIWTEELKGDWIWSPEKYLGGTPEFVVNTAKCAKEYFDDVIVYYDGVSAFQDGVYYLARNHFQGNDVVLSCNSIAPKKGNHDIYWTSWVHVHDKEYQSFDERIVISPYHQVIFGKNSRIVPLSCWPDDFKSGEKNEKQCLFSSAHDRGLPFLRSIWPEVKKRTGAKLVATYDKNTSEKDMVELYKSSQFWLHPGQGIELFCISAVKAQVAGCIPVVVPNMALETTVKYGVRTTLDNYLEDLIKAIENPPEVKEVDFGSWETVTKELFKNLI